MHSNKYGNKASETLWPPPWSAIWQQGPCFLWMLFPPGNWKWHLMEGQRAGLFRSWWKWSQLLICFEIWLPEPGWLVAQAFLLHFSMSAHSFLQSGSNFSSQEIHKLFSKLMAAVDFSSPSLWECAEPGWRKKFLASRLYWLPTPAQQQQSMKNSDLCKFNYICVFSSQPTIMLNKHFAYHLFMSYGVLQKTKIAVSKCTGKLKGGLTSAGVQPFLSTAFISKRAPCAV